MADQITGTVKLSVGNYTVECNQGPYLYDNPDDEILNLEAVFHDSAVRLDKLMQSDQDALLAFTGALNWRCKAWPEEMTLAAKQLDSIRNKPCDSKPATLSDITTIYHTPEELKSAQNMLENDALLCALGHALNGEKSRAIEILEKYILNNSTTPVDNYAKDLHHRLNSKDWQSKVLELKTFPYAGKDRDLSKQVFRDYIGIGSKVIKPYFGLMNGLLNLGKAKEAQKLADQLDRTNWPKEKRDLFDRDVISRFNINEGSTVNKNVLKKKSFNGHSIQEYLDQGKIVFVLRAEYWCPPCIIELKALKIALEKGWLNDRIQILVISADKPDDGSMSKMPQTLAKTTFPESSDSTGFAASAVPTTFVISPDGRYAAIFGELGNYGQLLLDIEKTVHIFSCFDR